MSTRLCYSGEDTHQDVDQFVPSETDGRKSDALEAFLAGHNGIGNPEAVLEAELPRPFPRSAILYCIETGARAPASPRRGMLKSVVSGTGRSSPRQCWIARY